MSETVCNDCQVRTKFMRQFQTVGPVTLKAVTAEPEMRYCKKMAAGRMQSC